MMVLVICDIKFLLLQYYIIINLCTKQYTVGPMYLTWNIKIKTLITDIYCTIFAITNIVCY